MTRTTDPPTSELGFELERFEFTAADRLEVSGRWFGVRGRRFVRPTMNLRASGRRRRLIAVLDHKPWPADGEGVWTAAFAWRGEHGEITNTRLEVAPDVVLDLPSPGDEAAGAVLHPRPVRRESPKPRQASPAPEAAATPPAAATPAPTEDAAPPGTPSPPTAAPSPPADASSSSATSPRALDEAERRLAGERAERERVAEALRDAEARIAALSEHGDAAVERANELVRLEGELAAAKEHIERVERDRVSAQDRGEAAERRIAAFRERAETAERELANAGARADEAQRRLAAAGDVAALRRRAEAAERDLAAARDRADAAERALAARGDGSPSADSAALRRRAEAAERVLAARDDAPAADIPAPRRRTPAPEARHVPETVLAARGVSPRRERGWGARAVGLVWIAVLLLALVAIVQLVF